MAENPPIKILLVDDDKDFISLVETFLTGHGYQVITALDATHAIRLGRNKDVRLIVLDLGMPAGGGNFVIESLRNLTTTKQLPIIVSTANINKGIQDKAIRLGANDLIAKPYNLEDLLAKIKTALSAQDQGSK